MTGSKRPFGLDNAPRPLKSRVCGATGTSGSDGFTSSLQLSTIHTVSPTRPQTLPHCFAVFHTLNCGKEDMRIFWSTILGVFALLLNPAANGARIGIIAS